MNSAQNEMIETIIQYAPIKTSKYLKEKSSCLVWVNHSVNISIVNALNAYFHTYWFFLDLSKNSHVDLNLITDTNDFGDVKFDNVFIINSLSQEITEPRDVIQVLTLALTSLKKIPNVNGAKYRSINHYSIKNNQDPSYAFANRLVNFLDIGCYTYLSECLHVNPTSIRVGFLESELKKLGETINTSIQSNTHLILTEPSSEIRYVTEQSLYDAIHIITDSINLRERKLYIEYSKNINIVGMAKAIVLAIGKSLQENESGFVNSKSIKIKYDLNRAIDPYPNFIYWADNLAGTAFKELLSYEERYISKSQYNQLIFALLESLEQDNLSDAIEIFDEKCYTSSSENKGNIINVKFKDIFN